jgi:adenine deaminase
MESRVTTGWIGCGFVIAAIGLAAAQQPRPFDILISNARIVDGSGGPSTNGSVGIRDGRIAAVGRAVGQATRTIDAGGRVLAPLRSTAAPG